MTLDEFHRQVNAGLLEVLEEEHDRNGSLELAYVEAERGVESDTALLARMLGSEVGGKQNILVFNDEAHHAYRIRKEEPDPGEADPLSEPDDADDFYKEATVWIEGLDRIHKLRGIDFCVDLSATPYFLGRVGQASNSPFPWESCRSRRILEVPRYEVNRGPGSTADVDYWTSRPVPEVL